MRTPSGSELLKRGALHFDLTDPYHIALTLRWPAFFCAMLGVEVLVNLAFALAYFLVPGSVANARPGSFIDAFFFSLETLATVGYGSMSPATLYGHVISGIELLVGLALTAVMTGLIFVRFSRPQSKILFADQVVVTRYDGAPALMVRVGNGRLSLMTDAQAQLTALLRGVTSEGRSYRGATDLPLVRSRTPVFALTWTLIHVIDENSPLFGYDADRLAGERVQLFLNISARDLGLGMQVHDLKNYDAGRVLFGFHYVDTVSTDDEGRSLGDLTLINEVEPDAAD